MSFQPGDIVRCTTPVGELEADKIYKVKKLTVENFNDNSTNKISLIGLKTEYHIFRFQLVGNPGDEAEVIETPVIAGLVTPITNGDTNTVSIYCGKEVALKNDQDKIDLSLIPKISNIEHAKAFMVGEKKYGRYNYYKGHKASQLVSAAKRHLDAWFDGESHDPVDGQHHLGSVMACCSMILKQVELGTLVDDRYPLDK